MKAKTSLRLLQVVLSVVLCAFSVELVVVQLHAPHRDHAFFVLLLLGLAEALAALVFLFAARLGGCALLLTFAFAAVLHILHGQASHIGALAIYGAAVVSVINGEKG